MRAYLSLWEVGKQLKRELRWLIPVFFRERQLICKAFAVCKPQQNYRHRQSNNCRSPGQSKDGYLSITVPPLSSVILIWKVCLAIDFLHLPKAWWTAAWSDSDITHPGHLADINNQPFSSSLFGITRPYIRPSIYSPAAKLLEANSCSPYKVIQSVVGQGRKEMGL